MPQPQQYKDITGQRFGLLTATRYLGRDHHRRARWHCDCDCGGARETSGETLRRGAAISCGCRPGSYRHGKRRTRCYRTYWSMLTRCYNAKNPAFRNHGARGIAVCERWRSSFENFFADMGDQAKGMTIERIDNDGDYEPSNCRWASQRDQMRNTRSNRMLTHEGVTLCVADWSDRTGIGRGTIHARLNRGWDAGRAVSQPA